MKRINPHGALVALDPPRRDDRRWRCRYCAAEGLYDDLVDLKCSYDYPPCPWCGETPECSLTCEGIAAALSDPRVHLVVGPARGEA